MKGSLQIKGKKYYAVFRVDGKLKWFSLGVEAKPGNKKKAQNAMTELVARYNANHKEFEGVEFTEYIKKWLSYVEKTVDIITYEGYKQYAEKHIIPYFETKHLALRDVKIGDIEAYYNYKAVTGRLDGKPGGLSARTIKLHSVILNLVFKRAFYEGYIRSNPCEFAKLPKINKPKQEPAFYTVEQCHQLLDVVKDTPLYAMIYITIIYGLRRSELMGLKWSAVDFDNNIIAINHTVVVNSSVVAKDSTKNGTSKRKYPLLPDIKKILFEIQNQQYNNSNFFGNTYINSDYVFTREDGRRYYPSYPTEMFQKYIKRYNLKRIRWHDLRHSCASMLILKGWHMKDISEWLGHADIGTTMNIYAHIDMQHKRDLGDTLSGLLE